MHENMNKTLK